jgi:hypothetical protein
MLVPSVIVPDEYNVLINPAHANSQLIKTTVLRRWIFDCRLFK